MKTNRMITTATAGAICAGAILLLGTGASAENLFVSDYFSNAIYEYTPDGRQFTFASGLNGPSGLAFDKAGDLFEADYGSGNIYEFTPEGVQTTFASGLNGPIGLAFNSAGDLFEADNVSGNVYKFTPDGARSTVASGLYYPQALALDSAGDVFVAIGFIRNNNKVIKITPDGEQSTFASFLQFPPIGLACNRAGNLFVANNDGNIYEFTPDGAQSTFAYGSAGIGLAFDSAGDLFEASGNIIEFAPDGTQSTFASGSGISVGMAFDPVRGHGPTVYIGNPADSVVNGNADGLAPLVIMGEYAPAGPLPTTTQPLPDGKVENVKFYGQNYDFTLYALELVSSDTNANEQTFKVVAAEHFSGSNSVPGTITLPVSDFHVKAGDFLAWAGIGPWYPQQPNDALNTCATYEDASQPNFSDNFTATPPVMGEQFSVGINRDTGATYGYISDYYGNQGRTYALGVDVRETGGNEDHRPRHGVR